MLDGSLVPFAMVILWYLEIVPGSLALISVQDFGSFLWAFFRCRAEHKHE